MLPPYESTAVGGCFRLGSVNEQLLQGNNPFFLQAAQELVMEVFQDLRWEPAAFEFIESIPPWLLSLGEPDEGKVPLARLSVDQF